MNYWALIRQSLTISGSRLVALSMVSLDLMILGRFSLAETADFALAVQFSQVYIVLGLGLTVGVNIAFNMKKSSSSSIAGSVVGYALLVGSLLFLMSMAMGVAMQVSVNARDSYYALAVGIIPVTIYIALCALIEASGGAGWVFRLTAGAAVVNVILDVFLINLGWSSPAVAVACATTLVRILLLGFVVHGCLVRHRIAIWPNLDLPEWKNLFSYGRSEALVGLIFTGGMSLLFAYVNSRGHEQLVALLAIGINFLNIASVIYIGMTRAVGNAASERSASILGDMKGLAMFGLAYVAISSVGLHVASPLLSWLYLGTISTQLLSIFFLAIWIVAFDGLAMLFITLLRLLDWRAIPPLLRLSLIVVGVPLSLSWFDPAELGPVFNGLLIGNVVAAALAAVLLVHAVADRMRREVAAAQGGN